MRQLTILLALTIIFTNTAVAAVIHINLEETPFLPSDTIFLSAYDDLNEISIDPDTSYIDRNYSLSSSETSITRNTSIRFDTTSADNLRVAQPRTTYSHDNNYGIFDYGGNPDTIEIRQSENQVILNGISFWYGARNGIIPPTITILGLNNEIIPITETIIEPFTDSDASTDWFYISIFDIEGFASIRIESTFTTTGNETLNDNFGLSEITFYSAVPLPASALLFGSGLIGLLGLRRRRQT